LVVHGRRGWARRNRRLARVAGVRVPECHTRAGGKTLATRPRPRQVTQSDSQHRLGLERPCQTDTDANEKYEEQDYEFVEGETRHT